MESHLNSEFIANIYLVVQTQINSCKIIQQFNQKKMMPMDYDQMFLPYFFQWEPPCPQLVCQPKQIRTKKNILYVYIEKTKLIKEVEINVEDLLNLGYEIKKRRWTQAEDQKLLFLAQNGQIDWEQISKEFLDRNAKMCYNRFRRLENSHKRSWTQEDNKKMLELIQEFGDNWKAISQHFPQKSQKQLKDHYLNYLRPDLDRSNWDLETDLTFVSLLSAYGCDWVQIQKHMPNRSYPHIKNRYYGRIAKIIAEKLKDDLEN